MNVFWNAVAQQISRQTGSDCVVRDWRAIGGGSINESFVVQTAQQRYFVKRNAAAYADMFAAEFAGLQEIARSHSLRVPQALAHGQAGEYAYLVLEYLPLGGKSGVQGAVLLGQQLAAMHKVTQAQFGWFRDNTIGSTPQPNAPCGDWPEFWRERRLLFQLSLLRANGYARGMEREIERLAERLPALFVDYRPLPSLLHGDLWSGNYGMAGDQPVIFDPAVYYGDREADIAMTELFGGFAADFYRAYNAAYPLHDGYALRKTLYNLYHIMNHVNLFGGGYLGQAKAMVGELLSELA